jgi:hypothetical protein
MPKQGVEARFIGGVDGYEALALLLVEMLLFEHAEFEVGCVHSRVFDRDIEFRQVEIRPHGVAAERIIASAKFQCPLREAVVLVEIYPAFHASLEWPFTSTCESGMASDSEARHSAAAKWRNAEIWLSLC